MSWIIPAAILLDLLFADPLRTPHPVQAVGRFAELLEKPAHILENRLVAGALALAGVLLATGLAVFLLTSLPFAFGTAAALYFAWSGLALGGLLREGERALTLIRLAQGNSTRTGEAREAVQRLVSRDTSTMTPQELCRSLAESVSENLNDAFVAPLFWLCLTGPVGMWVYKAASTMDSMWGYKNERRLFFGRAAARLDDVLAYIPARITVVLLVVAVWLARLWKEKSNLVEMVRSRGVGALFCVPGWPGLRLFRQQAKLSDSPNAGRPMAAAAWLFNGKTGGPTLYDGKIINKPFMGPEDGLWTPENTASLLRHARLCGVICLVLFAL